MPLSEHYSGHGEKIAEMMKKKYGKDWKKVFYATENKKKSKKKYTRADAVATAQLS